jgi:predicted nucleotidyltransferase
MTKNEILEKLRNIDKSKFDIIELGLFGSYSKEEANEESDIDILVKIEFKKGMYKNFCALQDYLETLFDKKVDLLEKSTFDYKYKNENVREFKEEIKKEILESVIYV